MEAICFHGFYNVLLPLDMIVSVGNTSSGCSHLGPRLRMMSGKHRDGKSLSLLALVSCCFNWLWDLGPLGFPSYVT